MMLNIKTNLFQQKGEKEIGIKEFIEILLK